MSLSVTGIEHRKIEPITKHLFPWQDKSTLLAKPNQWIGEEIRGYNNHAQKRSGKAQIIFMDNLIINSQFIGSQQTHCKQGLHRIELQEHRGEHCIEDQKERISHLATSYGTVGLWYTTHASSEGQQG